MNIPPTLVAEEKRIGRWRFQWWRVRGSRVTWVVPIEFDGVGFEGMGTTVSVEAYSAEEAWAKARKLLERRITP